LVIQFLNKISLLFNEGLVDFVNNVVPDAKLDPNGSDVFERLKDGVILWYTIIYPSFDLLFLFLLVRFAYFGFTCLVSLSKRLTQVF
jgi:hypothetical protein